MSVAPCTEIEAGFGEEFEPREGVESFELSRRRFLQSGALLNEKTGLNQLMGGIVWGISFAMHEAAHLDPVYGRTVNANLAEYHVPVNADIGTLDVTILNIPDMKIGPQGARGIGEIGITGAAAAVANAIYNATGKRVREYPITPDKLMTA